MNNLLRVAFRFNNLKSLLIPVKSAVSPSNAFQQRQMTRKLWQSTCRSLNISNKTSNKLCTCGWSSRRRVHSTVGSNAAERELVEFLTEEILAERKAQKSKTLPTELAGFQVQLNGAEVRLVKKADNEKIQISFNVNHTVDTDVEPEVHQDAEKPELGELKSKPAFKVEIIRDKVTLSLLCSFIGPNDQEEGYNDIFEIDEISIYSGEWNENIYAVSGEIVDSYLYDLILNYLEEKGISNEFAEKLSEYSTLYEHSAYIGLLEGLSKFVSGK